MKIWSLAPVSRGKIRSLAPLLHNGAVRDEDDWVGEPPEGRHPREAAKPEFWRTQRPPLAAGVGIAVAIAVLVAVILLG